MRDKEWIINGITLLNYLLLIYDETDIHRVSNSIVLFPRRERERERKRKREKMSLRVANGFAAIEL